MCPPSCPDTIWFKKVIESYQHANIYFETIEFESRFELLEKRRSFQEKLLEEEHKMKRSGNFYALCFFSGVCSMCGDTVCHVDECKRIAVRRAPICATGIDIMHLCHEILGLPREHCISCWIPLLRKEYFEDLYTVDLVNEHLCIGLLLY
jgi:predicted metal-binding protein